jgi:hypothetical protein
MPSSSSATRHLLTQHTPRFTAASLPTSATFLSIDSSLSGVESFHDLSNGAAADEDQCGGVSGA